MINLTDSDLHAHANVNGSDICFILYSDNSTRMNHEIENYTSSNGGLLAWVNVTALSSKTDTKIWMYYGNPVSPPQQNKYGTWNSHYLGVYHMNQASGTVVDSTSNKKNSTKIVGNPTYHQKGQCGYCMHFDGVDDSVVLPRIYTTQKAWSWQVWYNVTSHTVKRCILSQVTSGGGTGAWMEINTLDSQAVWINNIESDDLPTTDKHWHLGAYVNDSLDPNKTYMYMNTARDSGWKIPTWPSLGFNISDKAGSGKEFIGYIDEVRLSDYAWNTTWIDCDYNTTSSPSTFFMLGGQERCSWWNKSWGFRKLITIHHEKVSDVSGITLRNFPVMINLTDSDLHAHANVNGSDICFILYSDNSTRMNHEIENYTSSNGGLLAWVNVTALSSKTDTKIWMYYGNPVSPPQQNKYRTWNSHYLGVYHMNQASGTVVDSTSNKKNSTKIVGNPTYHQKGQCGYCMHFDGTDDSVVLPRMYTTQKAWTWEIWYNCSNNSINRVMLSQRTSGGSNGAWMQYNTANMQSTWINNIDSSDIATTKFHWHLATYVNDSSESNKTFQYMNKTQDIGWKVPTWPNNGVNISDKPGSGKEWYGYLDEVRFLDVALNSTWVRCDYNATSSPLTFYGVGAQEMYSWANTPPTQSSPHPVNASTGVKLRPQLAITVSDVDSNHTMSISWRSNSSGSWVEFGHNTTIANGTYRMTAANFTGYAKKYWWRVVLRDSYGAYTNATYYLTTITHPPGSPLVTTHATSNVGNTNATLNMCLQDDGGKNCSLWFNCTEYHAPISSGTGNAITLKWEKALNCSMDAGCVAKDIDGDGIMEIFVAGEKLDSNNTHMDVMCFKGDTGAVLWEKDLGYMDHCSYHIPIFIADLNDDGNFEMVLPAHNHTYALNCRDGSWFWNASVWSGYHQLLVFDALGNGFPFVYVAGYVSGYSSPYKVYKLWGRNGTVAATSSWNAVASDGGISCADVNKDGKVELFICGGSASYPERCFDANLSSIWTYNTQSSSMAPALVDYNNDGYLEVVTTTSGSYNCAVTVLNGTSGALVYTNTSTGMCGHHNPSIFDFNDDGHFELATAYGNEPAWTTHAKVWDLTARKVIWTSPNTHSGEPPTFVNVMGDNTSEMMDWQFHPDNNVSIYNSTFVWKQNLMSSQAGIAYVWDVDNDGYNEIITLSWDNKTCCYDTQAYAPVLRARGETTFYSERKLYTNQYVPEPNRKVSPGHRNGTYSFTLYGLTPGTVYFSQAVAKNSYSTVCGNKSIFLTKPNQPDTLIPYNYSGAIRLTWHKGTGANTTYIERNVIPSWSRGSGTVIYNGTGISFNDSGLTPATKYYYQFWSFTHKQGLSQYSNAHLIVNGTTEAERTVFPIP